MKTTSATRLRGMTWNHERGIAPVLATSEIFFAGKDNVEITWEARPLQDFESQPLRELAETYDLIIIDHPHLGEAIRENLLLDLSCVDRQDELALVENQTVGQSHASYTLSGGQWALAVDAATPVSSYRPDRLDSVPQDWTEALKLARDGNAIMPLRSPHTLMALIWLARNHKRQVAEDPDRFMEHDAAAATLDQFAELVSHLKSDCFAMDPIAVYDTMSNDDAAPAFCPHAYGYINYAQKAFRPHVLKFTDIIDAGGGDVSGTVLGGTGIAVSALSAYREIATEYAFGIAGAKCQCEIWVQNGGQPGNAMAWEDKACNDLTHDFLRNTRATHEAAWLRPRHMGYLSFQTRSSELIAQFLKGELERKACIEALDHHYRSSFEC